MSKKNTIANNSERSNQEYSKKAKKSKHLVHFGFEGPLPPPHILEHYEAILDGAADRILKMAEN